MEKPLALDTDPRPWYRFGLVWMVIAGPATVVVAGFFTLWLAIRMPDPVLEESPARTASTSTRTSESTLMPALAARNHAATPGADLPAPRR